MLLKFARLAAIVATVCSVPSALAAEIYLPNAKRNATGTAGAGGKWALDVNVISGVAGMTSGRTWLLTDEGSQSLAIRKDADGPLTGVDDGETTPLQVDANGRLKVDAAIIESATAANGAALPAQTKITSGYDGSAVRVLRTDATGGLQVDVESSALPSGAATEAKQDALITATGDVEAAVQALDTSDVTVTSSALPTGASTEAKQDAGNTTLTSIDGKITAVDTGDVTVTASALPTGASTEATLSAMNTKVPSGLTVTTNRLLTDGSGVTQPVSAASLPLPAGAATEATLDLVLDEVTVVKANTAANSDGQITAAAEDVGTTAETQTAPAGAVAFIIQADDTNTANLRFAVGATATASRGIQLQPGRSEQLEIGANISVIAESGTQKYQIQWVIK